MKLNVETKECGFKHTSALIITFEPFGMKVPSEQG